MLKTVLYSCFFFFTLFRKNKLCYIMSWDYVPKLLNCETHFKIAHHCLLFLIVYVWFTCKLNLARDGEIGWRGRNRERERDLKLWFISFTVFVIYRWNDRIQMHYAIQDIIRYDRTKFSLLLCFDFRVFLFCFVFFPSIFNHIWLIFFFF